MKEFVSNIRFSQTAFTIAVIGSSYTNSKKLKNVIILMCKIIWVLY